MITVLQRHSKSSLGRAFSLVELLVGLAVIVVLCAILIPAISGVRDQAARSTCVSNLRQIYTGVVGYMGEHNAHFPPFVDRNINPGADWTARGWLPTILEPYLDSAEVWNCPAQPENRKLGYGDNPWRAGKSWYIPSYSVNAVIAGKSYDEVFSSLDPTRQILMTEGRALFWDKGSIAKTYMEAPHGGSDTNVFPVCRWPCRYRIER